MLTLEGLRQFEAQQLKLSDISINSKFIKIKGKGKDEKQKFLIQKPTAGALEQYINSLEYDDGYLFASPKGKDAPITTRAIRKFFTCPKYGIFSRCGIDPEKSTHGFRHYNITVTLEIFKGDLAKTRRRSRHSGFTMLQIYDDARTTKKDIEKLEGGFF